jgi:hypothetical protein
MIDIPPKEKAKKLVDKHRTIIRKADKYNWLTSSEEIYLSKECALIAVTEIINALDFDFENPSEKVIYYLKVKQEIEKL